MYNSKFLKSERNRRRKALVFTIIFHLALFGGITFGTEMGSQIKDTIKSWFQDEAPKPAVNAALVKNNK